jgi:transposase-like protein
MDDHSFMTRVEVLSVTDSGRRRRWSTAEKIRIVEESLSRPRMAASTARRYDISRTLLTRWRKDYRNGLLGCGPSTRFAPVMIAPAPAQAQAEMAAATTSADTIGIVLVNGRRLTVSPTIDPVILARLLPVLDGA